MGQQDERCPSEVCACNPDGSRGGHNVRAGLAESSVDACELEEVRCESPAGALELTHREAQ